MDAPTSLQPLHSNDCIPRNETDNREDNGTDVVVFDSKNIYSDATVDDRPRRLTDSDVTPLKKCLKKTKLKKRIASAIFEWPSTSSSLSSSSMGSSHKGAGVACKRRNPKLQIRRSGGAIAAIGLPLGMSFAAVIAQVLYKRDVAAERISPDHLSSMCMMAVRESLANVFGDRLQGLTRNFEQSFDSTLNTLRLIYESSASNEQKSFNERKTKLPISELNRDRGHCTRDAAVQDSHSTAELYTGICDPPNISEGAEESIPMDSYGSDLPVHGQSNQITCLSSISSTSVSNNSMISAFAKSVTEQSRSNDLKALELGLTMKRLKLKETQLALNYDLNHLERSKLVMGLSKASFKAEKFKTQLEDLRHAELIKKCIDCLIAGLFVMSISLCYGAYVYSYEQIAAATSSCETSSKEYNSWWTPKLVAFFNSRFHFLWCHVQVMSQMAFGVLMIFAMAYLLFQRSTTSSQTMPITFLLLLLGFACGYCGKICVDTLGGSGYLWLLYWEILCLLHFLSIVCSSILFPILYGPVISSQASKGNMIVSYWIRRLLFYATLLVFLPLSCGLMPFASIGQWKYHFVMKLTKY